VCCAYGFAEGIAWRGWCWGVEAKGWDSLAYTPQHGVGEVYRVCVL